MGPLDLIGKKPHGGADVVAEEDRPQHDRRRGETQGTGGVAVGRGDRTNDHQRECDRSHHQREHRRRSPMGQHHQRHRGDAEQNDAQRRGGQLHAQRLPPIRLRSSEDTYQTHHAQ